VFDAETESEEVATLETVIGGLKPTRSTKGGARDGSQATLQAFTSGDNCERKWNLIALVAEIGEEPPWQDKCKLQELLCEYHIVFAIENGERGETVMVQMKTPVVLNPRGNQPEGFLLL